MTTVFCLQIEDDDAFLKIKSSTSDEEKEGLPHFLSVLDEMLEDEEIVEFILEGGYGPVTWRHLVSQLYEPVVPEFLRQRGIEAETIWLYPLYKVDESEDISSSWPRPECP